MATFLTTAKMAPELAARVDDSVHGRHRHGRPRRARSGARLVSLVRLAMALALASLVGTVLHFQREDRLALERTRASLLDAVRRPSAALTDNDRRKIAVIEDWLGRFAGIYEGDFVADELRAPHGLDAALRRDAVYVRGPIAAFAPAGAVAAAAAVSSKDSFVRCLVDPPASRAEKAMLARVLASGADDGNTAHVQRLDDGEVTLPILLSAWSQAVASASDAATLAARRRQLEKAPVERGVLALKSEVLLVAMDEPGTGKGPTELDGERAHDVRVGVVDLAAARVLLRVRRHVDPTWVSEARRPVYASALDGCALALDVRERVTAR